LKYPWEGLEHTTPLLTPMMMTRWNSLQRRKRFWQKMLGWW